MISPPKIFGAVCATHTGYLGSAASGAGDEGRGLHRPSAARSLGDTGDRERGRPGPPATCGTGPREPYLLGELDDQWELVVLDEAQQLLFGDLPLEVIPAFVELRAERGR